MKVLIIGSGGREHAITWKLAQSSLVDEIVCAPGNAGIAQVARCIDGANAEDVTQMRELAAAEKPDLVVVGPEVPLALGVTDEIESLGIKVFGPNKKCSQLEASKSFTKAFLARHNIPTAKYKEYTNIDELKKDVGIFGWPMVLKADGLAAGKGVILAKDEEEALAAIDEMMGQKVFGSAGDLVVVEECLFGTEASVLCFVDGSAIVPMESAQDYKRIFDRDEGPNTGGMGTYSPSLLFGENPELERQIKESILDPTFAGFKADGLDFRGVLFIGIMITKDGPKVIEYNNRFGDPETQSLLRRLDTDLTEIFLAACDDKLSRMKIEWSDKHAICVVIASGGYPGSYEKGKEINIPNYADDDIVVFHAGTKFGENNELLTAGGRVLGLTVTAATHDEARAKAYAHIDEIKFEGAQYRTDIGIVYR